MLDAERRKASRRRNLQSGMCYGMRAAGCGVRLQIDCRIAEVKKIKADFSFEQEGWRRSRVVGW